MGVSSDDNINKNNINVEKETAIAFSADIMNKIFGFIGLAIFTRIFSLGAVGTAYTLMGVGFLLLIPSRSISIFLKQEVSDKKSRIPEYCVNGLIISAIYVIILVIPLVFIITNIFQPSYLYGVGILSMVIGKSVLLISRGIHTGDGNPGFSMWVDSIDGFVTLITQLSLIFTFGGPESILIGVGVSSFLVGLTSYLMRYGLSYSIKRKIVEDIFSFIRYHIVSSGVKGINQKLPSVLLIRFINPAFVAKFETSKRIGNPAIMLSSSIAESSIAKAAMMKNNNSINGKNIPSIITSTGVISLPIIFGAFLLGDYIMPFLFGGKYTNINYILTVVVIIFHFRAHSRVLSSLLNGLGFPKYEMYSNFIFTFIGGSIFVFGLLTTNSLLSLFGLAVGEVSRAVYLSYNVKSEYDIENIVEITRFGKQLFSALTMSGVILIVIKIISIDKIIAMLCVLLGSFVYFAILVSLSKTERKASKKYYNYSVDVIKSKIRKE